MQGTTKSGFKFNIPKTRLDDIRLLKAGKAVAGGDLTAVLDIAEALLGKDEEALYKHLEKQDGRVPITLVEKELNEIIALINAKKS